MKQWLRAKRFRGWLGLVVGSTGLWSAEASAQSAPTQSRGVTPAASDSLQARTKRMDVALAQLSKENAHSSAAPILSIVAGAMYCGIGVGAAYDKRDLPVDQGYRGILATESLVLGGLMLGHAIFSLSAGPTIDGDRYARFRRDASGAQWNAVKLSQYEGELYADASISGVIRRANGWLSVGAATAGAALITLGATSRMRGFDRLLVFVEGGVMLPFGTIGAIGSFTSLSSNEREWRKYRFGEPTRSSARLTVAPAFTRDGMLIAAGTAF